MDKTTPPETAYASPFSAPTLEAWRERAKRELKGTPLEKLVLKLVEGFEVQPLYASAPRRATVGGRAEGRNFLVVADLARPLADSAALAVADEAVGGVDAVVVASADDVARAAALPGLVIHGGGDSAGAAALEAAVAGRAVVWGAVDARGLAAGRLPVVAPGAVLLPMSACHDEGADAVTELAAGLALFVATLRLYEASGIDPATAAPAIVAKIAVSSDFLMQIAKLRAWRGVVRRVLEVIGAPETIGPLVWAEGSRRNLSRFDPWVNLLRGTASAFAAITGGADLVSVQPFDAIARPSDTLARRMARNTLHILRDESHVAVVSDPAAGSFAVESWTSELETRAWDLFRKLEGLGGYFSPAATDALATEISRANDVRDKRLRRRQDGLVGTSLYVAPGESLPDAHAAPPGPDDHRDAAAFESLRLRAMNGSPTVFIANVGPLGEQQARTAWVRDLFHVGGFRCIDGGDGFASSDDAARAFASATTRTAVISAADSRHAELVPILASALKSAGADHVMVAGRPGENEAAWKAAGVDTFVFAGIDVVNVLAAALEREGL